MLHGFRRFLKANEGVTAIEFAIVSPPLIFLLLGIIEYSIIFHLQSLATHAGNEASRMGKTGASYCDPAIPRDDCIRSAVLEVMGSWVTPARPMVVNVSSLGRLGSGGLASGAGGGGELVLYQSLMYWKPMTPFFFSAIANAQGIPITASVLVKNEDF